MGEIGWAQLLRLGLSDLGLTPATFWDLTPVELMLLSGRVPGDHPMTRAGFIKLAQRFPDNSEKQHTKMD
ncbi:MAG: phage tail assembly chaperone [Pseudomonadota bacterium]